jgi:hypothetical protein
VGVEVFVGVGVWLGVAVGVFVGVLVEVSVWLGVAVDDGVGVGCIPGSPKVINPASSFVTYRCSSPRAIPPLK